MTKIRAILIDDELGSINVLTNLLERTSSDIEIVATSDNLQNGVTKIKELQPDVIFLDVQMPNYAGYEIVNFFDAINFEIIFVTAYDKYALKAFELNAIDYLVKPINRNKLNVAIERLKKKLKQNTALIDYRNLLNTIKDKEPKHMVIPEVGNRRIINIGNIIAIEANGAYSLIHLKDNVIITASKNLKYFESLLVSNTSFFRSHRAWIVNLEHLKCLNKTKQQITFANGIFKAKISRARIEAFEKAIHNN